MAGRGVFQAVSLGKSLGRRKVLHDASFHAAHGRITVLLGRNGSGKSTLLDVATGWRAPDHGTVRLDDRVWTRPRLHQLAARGVFYLPERPPLSSAHSVGIHLRAVERRFGPVDRAGVVEALSIGPLLGRYAATLSGGEKARVAMALAVARRPRCLLADEPLAGLAPIDQDLLVSALRGLAGDGTAVVVTGHDVRLLLAFAHRVVWIASGTTLELGTPAEALVHERFRRDYLGPAEASGPSPP